MAKLLKLRRGTTTQHGSFTGAEGEVTIDTTKDTAVVHDGSTAGGTPLAKEDMSNVSSATIAGRLSNDSIAVTKIAAGTLPSDVKVEHGNIIDGTVRDAEINASAAIAGTKISPNFGSQNITTTGTLTMAGSLPTIILNDENNENDFNIQNINGTFAVGDIDAGAARLEIASNGTTTIRKNLDCLEGVDVTGNISVSGTVDGRDVAADGSKLDGIESGATADQTNAEIKAAYEANSDTNAFTNAYQTKLGGIETGATADQTAAEIRALVQSASDSQVFTDADHTKLNGIETGATADQSASEILTAIKTVDGAGSGLAADLVDGLHASSFLRSDTADTATGDITFSGGAGAITVNGSSDIRLAGGSWTGEYTGGIKIQPNASDSYFQYQGSLYFRQGSSAGNNRITIDSSGNLTAAGNVTAYSDARLKTDIHTINDALGICGKLRGVSYKWLENGKAGIGVIAQEVEEILPEVVLNNVNTDPATGKTTEVKSVDYGKIVGVLINAINELKEEVEELKNAKITG